MGTIHAPHDTTAATTTTSPAASPPTERTTRDRSRAVAIGVAVVAGIAVVVGNRWLFPLYSRNRDDSVYVAMARTMRTGHLTIPEDHWPFRPWATGLVDDRYAYKYAPPWPSALAVADALGSLRIALAATAAGTVVAVRSLAREVVDDARIATVAAVLLTASPIFLVQGSTYLPYLFSLLLACVAATCILRGARTGSSRLLALGGAVGGLAAFARPFDAVLLIAPVAVVAIVSTEAPRRARVAASFAAGLAPLVALDVAFNWIVLGGPLSLPFGVTGSADAFGFGERGVFESSTLPFHFGDGLAGAGTNLQWLPSWTFGGPILVALAAWGAVDAWRRRSARHPAQVALLSWVIVVPVAYVFFWGPWAMAFNWDGVQTFGPFYHLPLVVPLVVFGAQGLRALLERPPLAIGAIVAMVAFTAWSLPDKINVNLDGRDQFRAAERAVDAADLHDAVLFLPWRGESGFLGLTPFLEYDPQLDGDVLYAQDCGTAANDALLSSLPGRAGYRLHVVDDDHLDRSSSYAAQPIGDDDPDRRVDCER